MGITLPREREQACGSCLRRLIELPDGGIHKCRDREFVAGHDADTENREKVEHGDGSPPTFLLRRGMRIY
jgi:hypothetical protein